MVWWGAVVRFGLCSDVKWYSAVISSWRCAGTFREREVCWDLEGDR